jgi:hypothetical protein
MTPERIGTGQVELVSEFRTQARAARYARHLAEMA